MPQKAGLFAEHSWAAYSVQDELFAKVARADAGAEYPDFGCSVEMFTNQNMLEIETLGPLRLVEPGAAVEHIEQWSLHRLPDLTRATDAQLGEALAGIPQLNITGQEPA